MRSLISFMSSNMSKTEKEKEKEEESCEMQGSVCAVMGWDGMECDLM